jgi:hypothetical protein
MGFILIPKVLKEKLVHNPTAQMTLAERERR